MYMCFLPMGEKKEKSEDLPTSWKGEREKICRFCSFLSFGRFGDGIRSLFENNKTEISLNFLVQEPNCLTSGEFENWRSTALSKSTLFKNNYCKYFLLIIIILIYLQIFISFGVRLTVVDFSFGWYSQFSPVVSMLATKWGAWALKLVVVRDSKPAWWAVIC